MNAVNPEDGVAWLPIEDNTLKIVEQILKQQQYILEHNYVILDGLVRPILIMPGDSTVETTD